MCKSCSDHAIYTFPQDSSKYPVHLSKCSERLEKPSLFVDRQAHFACPSACPPVQSEPPIAVPPSRGRTCRAPSKLKHPATRSAGHSGRCVGCEGGSRFRRSHRRPSGHSRGVGVSRSGVMLILRRLISCNFGQTPIEKYALLSRRPVSEITFAERWGEEWPALSPAVGQPVRFQPLLQ